MACMPLTIIWCLQDINTICCKSARAEGRAGARLAQDTPPTSRRGPGRTDLGTPLTSRHGVGMVAGSLGTILFEYEDGAQRAVGESVACQSRPPR